MTSTLIPLIISMAFWLWIIRKYDRYEKEPMKMILFVLLVGGFSSTFIAGLINLFSGILLGVESEIWNEDMPSAPATMLFYLLVGLNEELVKFYVTWLLIRKSRHFNEPADALVYAMTVALGFAIFENLQYAIEHGNWVIIVRQFNATPLHVGLAALWGIGLAKTRFIRKNALLMNSLPYLLLAVAIHSVYNILLTYDMAPVTGMLIATAGAMFLVWIGVRRIKNYSEEGPFSSKMRDTGTLNL